MGRRKAYHGMRRPSSLFTHVPVVDMSLLMASWRTRFAPTWGSTAPSMSQMCSSARGERRVAKGKERGGRFRGPSPDSGARLSPVRLRHRERKGNGRGARTLLRHRRAAEARVDELHGDVRGLELLGEDDAHDVAGRAAHVVAVVAREGVRRVQGARRVLREPPLARARLRRDDDDLLLDLARLEERRRDAQGPDGANVDHEQLLREIEVALVLADADRLRGAVEVARVVDDHVHGLGDAGDERRHGLVLRDVDARDHGRLAVARRDERVEVRARRARRADRLAALGDDLLHELEAQVLLAAGHEDALALERAPVVYRGDVEVARVVVLLGLGEARDLVRERVRAAARLVEAVLLGAHHRLAHVAEAAHHGLHASSDARIRIEW